LTLSPDGKGGGVAFGELSIHVGGPEGRCFAKFVVVDSIHHAISDDSGRLQIESRSLNRQRTLLDGTPPQEDGFEETLYGATDFICNLSPNDRPGTLCGIYHVRQGTYTRSKALITLAKR